MSLRLYCATGNKGKLREFQQAAGERITIEPYGPLPCPEEGDTFEANAVQKALCYAKNLQQETPDALLFADDSGLAVDGLDGAPGVQSARFAGPGADDDANNRLLIEKLADASPEERKARYICVIALTRGGELLETFRGEAEGIIQLEPAGDGGFGYDPYFHFPPLAKTFAEITPEEKWFHSHRGKAFRQMLDWLKRQ